MTSPTDLSAQVVIEALRAEIAALTRANAELNAELTSLRREGNKAPKRKSGVDTRVRKLARFLKAQHTALGPCACYSCSGQYADDYAAKVIRTCEAAGLIVTDPQS